MAKAQQTTALMSRQLVLLLASQLLLARIGSSVSSSSVGAAAAAAPPGHGQQPPAPSASSSSSSAPGQCGLRRNASFATMQPLSGSTTASPEECCAAMRLEPRCNQSGVFVCRYFIWKDPCCYPFPQNCEYHTAAGPFLPDPSVDGGNNATAAGWLNAAPPPDAPPQGATVSSKYTVSAVGGLGLEWEGVGAISGGGATTKLLMDYEPQVASDILDYLFKPGFGLALQMLKVEIGGDTDATEGAESSHMHSATDPGDYTRGYEWWLMTEAKKRNPAIKLYGLSWGFPGWLNANATATAPADPKAVFLDTASMAQTANYTVQWLLGAQREHGLTIDYVGLWNERSPPPEYAPVLRGAVRAAGLAPATTVVGQWPVEHYGGTGVAEDPQNCTQFPSWKADNENASRWMDEEGSVNDGRLGRCLARCVNRNYVSFCKTATIQWHLISSFYDYLPWPRCGVAVANTPWSGGYEVTSATWVLAHTTQFAPIGWRYTKHFQGVQLLKGGGSIVTRVSPDGKDFSIVIEKMSASTSPCARGNNPDMPTNTEEITLQLQGAFAKVPQLQVWHSDLSQDVAPHANPADELLFIKRAPIPVGADGTLTFTLKADELYTLTTLTTGSKGLHPSMNRSTMLDPSLPLPYGPQTFDTEVVGKPGKYWYTQMGAWEVHNKTTAGAASDGKVLRQVSTVWPNCWNSQDCDPPKAWFGPAMFNDQHVDNGVVANFDVLLEESGNISLSLAPFDALQAKRPVGSQPPGTVTLCTNGTWVVGSTSGTGLNLTAGHWQHVAIGRSNGTLSAWVGGRLLASEPVTVAQNEQNFTLRLMLSHYYLASVDRFTLGRTAAVSSSGGTPEAATCATRHDVDFQGHDLQPVRAIPATDGAECCRFCANRTGCVAWTLQPADGCNSAHNCCYLKSSAMASRRFKGAISGTIGPLPPAPPAPAPPRPSDGSCHNAKDCSLGGLCVANKCKCDPAFTGPNCVALNLLPAKKGSAWNAPPRTSSWGGNPVWDRSDSKYHLFFAEFLGHCGLDSWGTNSEVSHAISDQPAGPYTKQGVVQGPFHHNPSVAYDNSTGTFLLYSIGNGSATPTNCSHRDGRDSTVTAGAGDPAAAGIITLSYAKTANGPWSTLPTPVLEGLPGKWDAFVTNPSVYIFPNGTVLMAYRGGWSPWHIGIAVAPSWRGPYRRVSDEPAFPIENEDPGLFVDQRNNFHMLTHYFGRDGPGGHAFSEDGLHWTFAGQAYDFMLRYDDGTSTRVARRERPQVLSLGGTPALLFSGVDPHGGMSWTQVQPINQKAEA